MPLSWVGNGETNDGSGNRNGNETGNEMEMENKVHYINAWSSVIALVISIYGAASYQSLACSAGCRIVENSECGDDSEVMSPSGLCYCCSSAAHDGHCEGGVFASDPGLP